MNPTNTFADRDLIDTLDRILDKGIVVDQWVRISLTGGALVLQPVEFVRVEKISIQIEGQRQLEREDLTNLFPYWRRDLWSK